MKLLSAIKPLISVVLLGLSAMHAKAAPLGTDFLYQGFLTVNGSPGSNSYQMTFTLYRVGDPSPGPSVMINSVPVSGGVFTVSLDFGAGVFDGTAYELDIAVREAGSSGQFTQLLPRQPLAATPNAYYAKTVSSVPDSALSSNVALLNGGPVFTAGLSVNMLRIAAPGGNSLLKFGPTDDCSIGIDPALTGLLLRDPRGVRIVPINPQALPTLRFGPTDDCSIGINPAFPGLIVRDPGGFRLLGVNNLGSRLIFGPTMDCTVEIRPTGTPGAVSGLLLRDPSGIRILPPGSNSLPRVLFGPTDDCSIGIDPALAGLLLRDPRGVRIVPINPNAPTALRFGPTDDCSIGIDPAFPGLIERDPIGLRLLGTNNQGGRLIFGPTMDCTVEIRPPGTPGAVTGLVLRDPSGIRILNPSNQQPSRLLFGPTDTCRIWAPDVNGGMRFTEPRGFTFESQVTINGPVFAQAFIQTSSRRFKNDVKPIEQPLEKISKLQGVRFTWNKEQGGREDIGFIAEEVGKVLPEVVSWEEDGQNARGVNYDHLVAVAIEGIKAQQSQIQTLEREKAELKESLNAMQTKLDRLTQQFESLAAR